MSLEQASLELTQQPRPPRPALPQPAAAAVNHPSPSLPDTVTVGEYLEILWSMCGDNLKGQKCHTPQKCMNDGTTFRCLDYPKCNRPFTHKMTIHTRQSCKIRSNQPCQKEGCAQEVDVYHVVATCKSLLTRSMGCVKEDCRWGHDFVEVRLDVMRERRALGATNRVIYST